MTKHTPGPWEVEDLSEEYWIDIWNGPTLVAQVRTLRNDSEVKVLGETNARLITAAPDLLEACKHLLGDVGYGGCGDKNCKCGRCKAQKAIIKAEGN